MIVLLLIAQAVLVVAGLTGIRQTHRRIDLTNPMVILLVLWIFLYTLQLIPTWDGTDVFSHVVAPWIAGNRAGQLRAAYVETAALAVMIVMYFAAGSLRFETTRASRVGPRYPINRARVVAVLGFILFVLLVISSHGLHALAFGIYNRTQFFSGKNYLALGPTIISTAGIATIIADGVWPPKRHGIVLFVTGELFGLFTGSKSSLAVPLITLAAVIYFLWRRFRLVTVVIAIAVVLASLTTYDLYFRNALPRQIPLTQAFDQLGGWSGVTNIFVGDALFAHQAMTIAVVEFGQVHPYLGADELGSLLLAPLPHSLVHNKGSAPSAAFTQTFDPQALSSGTSIPPTALGEMYMDFGFPGVLLGSGILAVALRLIYDRRFRSSGWLYTVCLTCALIGPYLRGETYGDGILFLSLLIPGLFILRRVPTPPRMVEKFEPRSAASLPVDSLPTLSPLELQNQ